MRPDGWWQQVYDETGMNKKKGPQSFDRSPFCFFYGVSDGT